ncbi:MAG TPA: RNA 2',3'-cyclic phosphodiesterase [Edaphobacter sp.]|nr:RNA 2',3'-cyclic phosphodiesterase [Edaphobacter sp.]
MPFTLSANGPSAHPTLMRLFLGLPVPSELAQGLTRLARTIELPKGRVTAPENLHLTLVFLGEVAEPTLPRIEQELFELTFAPFQIKLISLNTFPRAGILFVEVEPTRPLLHLQAKVAASMARCGFAPEDRPYHPHLTLARFHGSLRLSKSQQALPPSLQRSFTADTVNLYRSNLIPTGAHYEILTQKRPGNRVTESPTPDHQKQTQRRGHSR